MEKFSFFSWFKGIFTKKSENKSTNKTSISNIKINSKNISPSSVLVTNEQLTNIKKKPKQTSSKKNVSQSRKVKTVRIVKRPVIIGDDEISKKNEPDNKQDEKTKINEKQKSRKTNENNNIDIENVNVNQKKQYKEKNVRVIRKSPTVIKNHDNEEQNFEEERKSKIKKKKIVSNQEERRTTQEKEDISIKLDFLDELEKTVKINYYEIERIKYELSVIDDKEKDEETSKEIELLVDRLNKLIAKLEQIKKDLYSNNYSDIIKHITSDAVIKELMNEYKTAFNNNDDISQAQLLQIVQIREYINLLNEVVDVETKTSKLNDTLNEKKDKFDIRDTEFDKLEGKYNDIVKVNNHIKNFTNDFNYIVSNLEARVKSSYDITKTVEYKSEIVINYAKLLTATLAMSSSRIIPPTRGGNLLKTGLLIGSIASLASFARVRTKQSKTITKISYIDYESDILKNINSIKNVGLTIDKAMHDLKYIKEEFDKEFSEYKSSIPEFYELMINLNKVEKELKVRKQLTIDFERKLDYTLQKNNTKVKKLEEEYHS